MPRISNLEFLPGLFAMVTWAIVIGAMHLIVHSSPAFGYFLVPIVTVTTFVWAFRSRHNFGRSVSRGHFDEIDLLQLPPRTGDVDLWDPPTQVERTTEEQAEERELHKELSKAFQEGYSDNAEQKTDVQTVSFETDKPRKFTKRTKKKITGKSSDEFRKKQEAHYANEFAKAREMNKNGKSSDEFKKKQEAHYANEFAFARDLHKAHKTSKSSDEFRKKQESHYTNEFARAREMLEKQRREEEDEKRNHPPKQIAKKDESVQKEDAEVMIDFAPPNKEKNDKTKKQEDNDQEQDEI